MRFKDYATAKAWLDRNDGYVTGPVQKGDYQEYTAHTRLVPGLSRSGLTSDGDSRGAIADAIGELFDAMGSARRP